jgi:hypothetical protein
MSLFDAFGVNEKYKPMKLPEDTQAYYASAGWDKVLFVHVGDGHNDPPGQKMIWVTNQPYDPNGNNEGQKKGFMYLSNKRSRDEQFRIGEKLIYYRIRSYGVFQTPEQIIVVSDDAYQRMYTKLKNGERYVKSFKDRCPHNDKDSCDCEFMLNFLENDVVMGLRDYGNGMKKVRVVSTSQAEEYEGTRCTVVLHEDQFRQEGRAYIDHVLSFATRIPFPMKLEVIFSTGNNIIVDIPNAEEYRNVLEATEISFNAKRYHSPQEITEEIDRRAFKKKMDVVIHELKQKYWTIIFDLKKVVDKRWRMFNTKLQVWQYDNFVSGAHCDDMN